MAAGVKLRQTSTFFFTNLCKKGHVTCRLKKKVGTLFLVSLISFKTFRYIISVLGSVKILQRKGPIKGITCNGELGTSE